MFVFRSTDSVQADLTAVVEHRLERFFKVEGYTKCVMSKELHLLEAAVKGLTAAIRTLRESGDAALNLLELKVSYNSIRDVTCSTISSSPRISETATS